MKKMSTFLTLSILLLVAHTHLLAQFPRVAINGLGNVDSLYWYAGVPATLLITAGPPNASFEVVGDFVATVSEADAANGKYIVTTKALWEGVTPICAKVTVRGRVAMECINIVAYQPAMRGAIDTWSALTAIVGTKYDPSSRWTNIYIPEAHYQTVVEINGQTVFDRIGVTFDTTMLPNEFLIKPGTKSIRTSVYWRPAGTADRTMWVLLAANYETVGVTPPAVPLGSRRMQIVTSP